MLSSAQAVAGKVSEKAATPRAASREPRLTRGPRAGAAVAVGVSWPAASGVLTAIVTGAVALSLLLMQERSSGAELAAILRAELNRYSPGEKLPSSRALVERHRVSPVTVSRALAELAAEGLVTTRPGAGAFRAEPRSRRPGRSTPPGRRSR